MENSIKETIKIIERKIKEAEHYLDITGLYLTLDEELRNALINILSDYKKVLEENEELKNDYENLNNSVVVKNHCIKNSIPVQKVKDKIEELKQEKKKYGNCLIEMYEDELVNRDIKILQELLEGRK